MFIAANVILHATKDAQSRHLDELLPPIVPLLTSHHHSLRGFTQVINDYNYILMKYFLLCLRYMSFFMQLLVYQVFSKLLPVLDSGACGRVSLEKRCFMELKSYLEDNSDCARYIYFSMFKNRIT